MNAIVTVVGQDKLLSAAEAKWNQNSAAALATGLTDGTPCPVCGAVHHPVLAVPCAGETTKEELDALRKKLEDLRQEQSRAEQTAAAAILPSDDAAFATPTISSLHRRGMISEI